MTPATIVILDGVEQPISAHALDYGIPAELIVARLRRGWDVREAIEMPANVVNGSIGPDDDDEDAARKAERLERRTLQFGPVPKLYTYEGQTLSVRQWSELTGIGYSTINARLKAGWPIGEALGFVAHTNKPRGPNFVHTGRLYTHADKTLNVAAWSEITGIKIATIYSRLRQGLTFAEAITVKTLPFGPNSAERRNGKALAFGVDQYLRTAST